jgi:hypothetical protein
VYGSAKARHQERRTSTKKARVSSTSLRVKRAVVELWSVFFSWRLDPQITQAFICSRIDVLISMALRQNVLR